MEKPTKFLPPPNFGKKIPNDGGFKPHYLTPSGMTLLPREKQPPPMYGPRGTTIPAKFLQKTTKNEPIKERETPPPAGDQYCEACEMNLRSMDDMHWHRAQHQRCPINECNYRGVAEVMDKHVNALHTSGLYDKFKKLNTPEEIAAWREERRKKYPTLANVQMRQRAQEQKQKRGERLETNQSRFGKREDRKRAHTDNVNSFEERKVKTANAENINDIPKNRKRHERRKFNKRRKMQENNAETNQKPVANKLNCNEQAQEVENELKCGDICMFKGTALLKDYKHAKNKKQVEQTNALTNLFSMYGSDSEDSDNEASEDEQKNWPNEKCNIGENLQTNAKVETILNNTTFLENTKRISHQREGPSRENDFKTNKFENILPDHEADPLIFLDKSEDICKKENDMKNEDDVRKVSPGDGNSSDDAPYEEPIARNSLFPVPNKIEISKEIANSHNEPQEKHKKEANFKKATPPSRIRKFGLDYRKTRLRKQNTMLEKLLEPDIRHERNVLLQCVRFVCENNFFDAEDRRKNLKSELIQK